MATIHCHCIEYDQLANVIIIGQRSYYQKLAIAPFNQQHSCKRDH